MAIACHSTGASRHSGKDAGEFPESATHFRKTWPEQPAGPSCPVTKRLNASGVSASMILNAVASTQATAIALWKAPALTGDVDSLWTAPTALPSTTASTRPALSPRPSRPDHSLPTAPLDNSSRAGIAVHGHPVSPATNSNLASAGAEFPTAPRPC